MTPTELQHFIEKATTGEITNGEIMLVIAAMFESVSKGKRETKVYLDRLEGNLDEMSLRLQRVEKHCTSPIWGVVVDEPAEDECPWCGQIIPHDDEEEEEGGLDGESKTLPTEH